MSKNGHVYNFVNYILPFSLGHHGGRHCRVTSNWSWESFFRFHIPDVPVHKGVRMHFSWSGSEYSDLRPSSNAAQLQYCIACLRECYDTPASCNHSDESLSQAQGCNQGGPFWKPWRTLQSQETENSQKSFHECMTPWQRRLRISIRLVFDPWIKKYISRYLNFFSFLWLLQSHGIHPYCKLLIQLTFRASTK